MFLVFTKKFSGNHWKILDWTIYISLVAIAIWFTWGVFEKFAKQETAIQQYEDKIEAHPTISLCLFDQSWLYQEWFNINYTTYQHNGLLVADEVTLKIGKNYLKSSGENVNLNIIYTRYNLLCYVISTTRKVDESETDIKIWSSDYEFDVDVFFTSEKNFHGATRRDWRDGEAYSVSMEIGKRKDITLTVEKKINLK